MPQVKEPLLRTLIKEALREAELTVGDDNTIFQIKISVSNPQSETKLGIRIQLKPKSEDFLFTDPDKKGALSVAIMKKLNNSLGQFDIQVSKDTDAETQDPTVLGFFIPLSQIKNMIVKSLGGKTEIETTPPPPGPSSDNKSPIIPPPNDLDEQEDPLDRAARLAKEPIAGMGVGTGLGLKRKGYEGERGGELSIKDLYEKVSLVSELLITIYKDINNSDYGFKEYLNNNEDQYSRVGAVMSMIEDELEDRLELEEPVDEEGIEEQSSLRESKRKKLNEMRVRELKEISNVVIKEDFYSFINAGNNVLRTLEENGLNHINGKKYLEYLVKHNIM